jgi:hypothetical protein
MDKTLEVVINTPGLIRLLGQHTPLVQMQAASLHSNLLMDPQSRETTLQLTRATRYSSTCRG